MRGVPWWGLVSSAVAPVLLAGGWAVAAGLQPGSFDAVSQTISALASDGAADRWVMTVALLGVGACYVLTGLALRPAAPAGRLILIAGGIACILVAANPEPVRGGSLAHGVWATSCCIALTVWPAASWRRGSGVPWGLRPAVSVSATAIMLCLLAWFETELITGSGQAGLAERILAETQAVWPLIVMLTAAGHPAGGRGNAKGAADPLAVRCRPAG